MIDAERRIIDPATVARVRKRDGVCLYGLIKQDGCRGMLEVHHIIRRSAGGDDVDENLIVLCGKHHRDLHEGRINTKELMAIMGRFYGYRYSRQA